jgi:hypothetical protein
LKHHSLSKFKARISSQQARITLWPKPPRPKENQRERRRDSLLSKEKPSKPMPRKDMKDFQHLD